MGFYKNHTDDKYSNGTGITDRKGEVFTLRRAGVSERISMYVSKPFVFCDFIKSFHNMIIKLRCDF